MSIKPFKKVMKEVMTEGMKDASKLDFSQYDSNATEILQGMVSKGMKVKVNENTLKGVASYKGINVNFSIGGENLYIELNRLYTKEAVKPTLDGLTKFLDVIHNFGGQ